MLAVSPRSSMRLHSVRRGACVMLGAVALFAGCGGREGGGGTVVIGSGQDPKSLFPPTAETSQAREVVELLFQRLADRGAALNTLGDSGFVPRLALRWEWSRDSLRVTFHLDPRARWEDGHAVSAEDVKFAFDLYADSTTGARERTTLIATVDSISVGDSITCTAWFHRRSPEQFDELVTTLFPLPAHLLRALPHDSLATSAFARKPVGDGPFKLAAWEPEVRLEIRPSETYSGARPRLQRVIWTFAPDGSTRFKQLAAGESDFLENLTVGDAATAGKQANLRIVRLGTYSYNFLQFNLHDGKNARPHPLFGDRALRRALTMALDRQLLVHSVFDSLGRVGLGPFVRAQWASDTTVAQIGFDRTSAMRTLDSLGWRAGPDGLRARNGRPLAFTLLVPTIPTRLALSVLIQEQLRAVGVTVNVEKIDGNAMVDREKQGAFDAVMGGFTSSPSPSGVTQTWTTSAAAKGGLNYGHYESKRFDAEVDSAGASGSLANAKAHYKAANQIIVDDAPAIWLYEPPILAGANARLQLGAVRADAWWMGIPGWTIAPGKQLPRDKPATPP
jgi:peptide/nickel transport system substrate-binding protein